MKIAYRHFLLCILLLSGCLSTAFAKDHVVWRLGEKNGFCREFALHDVAYSDFSKRYTCVTTICQIGTDDSRKIPCAFPGPKDVWAGKQSGELLVRFGVGRIAPQTRARLVLDFVEVHPYSPPVLEITVNGFRTKVQTPAGKNSSYFQNRTTDSHDLAVSVALPEGTLQVGENRVSVRNDSGSWVVWDALTLTADAPVTASKLRDKVELLGAKSSPALMYGEGQELLQPVRMQIANWGAAREAEWGYDGRKGGKIRLERGLNQIEAGIPESFSGREVTVAVQAGNKPAGSVSVRLDTVDKWTIYLVQHTHTDIGYTKPQTEILTEHLRYIDYAVEYCEMTERYPDDSKFRWTCETAWAVKEWLRIRPEEQVRKFMKYVRNGQIEVTAMFFNMSELSGENAYKTFLAPVGMFRRYGLPVSTAMQNDVNGVAWCLADYLPDLGVRYLTMGSNNHRALIPFEGPTVYKWESPSGKSLISYRSDHYNTGNHWGIERGDMGVFSEGVFAYIDKLKRQQYPFDVVSVQYSGYFTDNSPPSAKECELIRAWNEKYAWPKLRSALIREFLDDVSSRYADKLPVYRAAYPDWWTDGFGSAARETGVSRRTQSDMITIEGMLSMAVLQGRKLFAGVKEEIRRIHENLLFYDEHTFGASESIRDPMSENSQVQWAQKGSYAWEGLKSAQMLYEASVGLLQPELRRSSRPTITFFNSLGWQRSGLVQVYIDYEIVPIDRAFRIVDERGHALDVQPVRSRREGRYYAIYAEDIPALGYRTYEIVLDEGKAPESGRIDMTDHIVENDYYRIAFDPRTGAVNSLLDKELGLEMVDSESPWQLGAFIYESLENDRKQMERHRFDHCKRSGLTDVRFVSATSGPIYQSVGFVGKSLGCDEKSGVKTELRLYNHTKRIELAYSMRRLPETEPSGIYVAFPFRLDGAELLFDVPGGMVSPGENQIPGTSAGWNTVQHVVAARNGRAQFLVGCDQVPLFQLGSLLDDPYQIHKTYEKPHVFSWVMNNYWTTNFRASQEGEFRWSYYMTSGEDVSNSAALRFGMGGRVPLYARVVPGGKENGKSWERSNFRIGDPNLIMTSCSPAAADGSVLLNVREVNGVAAQLTLTGKDGRPIPFEVVNAVEEGCGEPVSQLAVEPYGNRFVRVKL